MLKRNFCFMSTGGWDQPDGSPCRKMFMKALIFGKVYKYPGSYLAPGGVFFHGSQLGVDPLDVVLHLAGCLVNQVAEAGESGA